MNKSRAVRRPRHPRRRARLKVRAQPGLVLATPRKVRGGELHVLLPNAGPEPVPARSAVPLTHSDWDELVGSHRQVVVLVDEGQSPVVLGVLQPFPAAPRSQVGVRDLTTRVDGKRLELDAVDELVLRCGSAAITLRSNGRVVVEGIQVESKAKG